MVIMLVVVLEGLAAPGHVVLCRRPRMEYGRPF